MTTANISATFNIVEKKTAVLGKRPEWSGKIEYMDILTEGTTVGKFDLVYTAERTVTTGANDDIDLSGVLVSPLGTSVVAAEIVALLIINRQRNGTANTTNLTIGAGANPWIGALGATHTIGPIRPGGVVMLAASDAAGLGAVTAGTGDILRVANSAGASNTYQIAILGRTA